MTDDNSQIDEKAKRHQERMQQRKEIVDAAIARADEERGVVIVLTGDGKGKSSSGFGTALRCLGHGYKVAIVQFIKGTWEGLLTIFKMKDRWAYLFHTVVIWASYVVMFWIPFYALGSYFIFKKTKQNYTENLVLNTYLTIGILILGLIFPIITIFYTNTEVLYYLKVITPILTILYIFWFYYEYFSAFDYRKISLVIRIILITVYIMLFNGAVNTLANKIGVFLQH